MEISTVSNICGRYINFLNGDPLLIIYNDPEKTDLHLARFSRNNLQITYKSEIVVLNNSPIWVFENFVYVVGLKRDAFLYKLNRKMQSIAKSSVPIYPDTQVTFTRNQIYCTVLDGNQNYKIVVLKAENLEKIVEIE